MNGYLRRRTNGDHMQATAYTLADKALDFDNLLAGKLLADILTMVEHLDRLGESRWEAVADAKRMCDADDIESLAYLRDEIAKQMIETQRGRALSTRLKRFVMGALCVVFSDDMADFLKGAVAFVLGGAVLAYVGYILLRAAGVWHTLGWG